MERTPPAAERFHYDGYAIDPVHGSVRCAYSTGGHTFTEEYQFGTEGDWAQPAVEAAVRLLYLLAGVSYYKTTAAPLIELGTVATTPGERNFLRRYYQDGLGEFAYRNDISLGDLQVIGPDDDTAAAVRYTPTSGRPLIPFGGGIDSIVTVDAVRRHHPEAALCVVHPPGGRYAAIEDAAAVTALPIVHIVREIDPMVRRSGELGFLNGHVPVTAIVTAAAMVAAVLDRRDAVILSNEWSASSPTIIDHGRPINHQWSKGEEFERAFAGIVEERLGPNLAVFSYLRPRSELWVARQFTELSGFHATFRSCNRAFQQDPAQRLDHWCGQCDKCCFIDLILAPFMTPGALADIFSGLEPLENADNAHRFATLLGLEPNAKPFECVGDISECRSAIRAAAARPDRQASPLLQQLARRVDEAEPAATSLDILLAPLGHHYIPERYAPTDLLVRAR
jgi:hypothetical protein